jgi:hypothetical protein
MRRQDSGRIIIAYCGDSARAYATVNPPARCSRINSCLTAVPSRNALPPFRMPHPSRTFASSLESFHAALLFHRISNSQQRRCVSKTSFPYKKAMTTRQLLQPEYGMESGTKNISLDGYSLF